MNVLAHAGGTSWDEILLAGLPFAMSGAIVVLVRAHSTRVNREHLWRRDTQPGPDSGLPSLEYRQRRR